MAGRSHRSARADTASKAAHKIKLKDYRMQCGPKHGDLKVGQADSRKLQLPFRGGKLSFCKQRLAPRWPLAGGACQLELACLNEHETLAQRDNGNSEEQKLNDLKMCH